jgi:hypothetical protein
MSDWWERDDAIPGTGAAGPNPGYSIKNDPDSDYAAKPLKKGIPPQRRRGPAAARAEKRSTIDGRVDYRQLGNDDAAIRAFVSDCAAGDSYTFEDLIVQPGRGRLSAEEQRRRDLLAGIVRGLRDRGAALPAIARVIGCSTPTALRLERHGRALAK